MAVEGRYRYPRINFFTRDDEDIFCGRAGDAQRLFTRLMLSNTLVLHGESGTGKSSLVQAGLLPLLTNYNTGQQRKEERQKEKKRSAEAKNNLLPQVKETFNYIPVTIRLDEVKKTGEAVSNETELLLKHTLEKIAVHKNEIALSLPFIGKQENSLWYTAKLFERTGQTLLLIFDQFEELQTYTYATAELFTKKLAELFATPMPESVYEEYEKKTEVLSGKKMDEEQRTAYCADIRFLEQPLRVKILFVVREDKLGTMSLLSDYFPDILKNDFLLLPLTKESARHAIAEPAKHPGKFISPAFEFEPQALEFLLQSLLDTDTGLYDPIQLQIVCSNIERKIAPDDQFIEVNDIPKVSDIITDFYTDVWESVKGKTKSGDYDGLRKRIIEKLVVGGKRNLVHENLLLGQNDQADIAVVAHLVKEGLLKKISGKDPFYQLTHDRMVYPLQVDLLELEAKEKAKKRLEEDLQKERLQRANRQRWYWVIASFVLLVALIWAFRLELQSSALKKQAEEDKYLVTSTMLKLERNPTMAYVIARDWYENKHSYADRMKNYLSAFDSGEGIFLSGVYPALSDVSWTELSDDKKKLILGGKEDSMTWDLEKRIPHWSSRKDKRFVKSFEIKTGRLDFFQDADSFEIRNNKGSTQAKVKSSFDSAFYSEPMIAASPNGQYVILEDSFYNAHNAKGAIAPLPDFVVTEPDVAGKKKSIAHIPTAAVFLNDNKHLAIGYESGPIVRFEIKETGKTRLLPLDTLRSVSYDENSTSMMVVDSADTYLFAAQKKGGITVINLAINKKKNDGLSENNYDKEISYSGLVNSMAISSNGKLLLTGSSDGTIGVWKLPKIEPLSFLKWQNAKEVRSVSFSTDNKDILAVTSDNVVVHYKIGKPLRLYANRQLYRFSPFNYAILGMNTIENQQPEDTASSEGLFSFTLRYLLNIPTDNEFQEEPNYTSNIKRAGIELKHLYSRLHQKEDFHQKIPVSNEALLDVYYYRLLRNEPNLLLYADSLTSLAKSKLEALSQIGSWKLYFLDTANQTFRSNINSKTITEFLYSASDFITERTDYKNGLAYVNFYRDSVLAPFTRLYPENSLLKSVLRLVNVSLFRYYLFTGNYVEAREYASKTTSKRLKGLDSLYLVAVELAAGNEPAATDQFIRLKNQMNLSRHVRFNFRSLLHSLEMKNINSEGIKKFRKRFNLAVDEFL